MTKLEKLYSIIENSREVGVKLSKDVLQQVEELEEGIIKEEILPALGNDIAPRLEPIKRDLVLVVEYHPGEPISVALSRKTKISEIMGAKTLTPRSSTPVKSEEEPTEVEPHEPTKHIENTTKGMRVTFPDGRTIQPNKVGDALVEVVRYAGAEKVRALNIEVCEDNLVLPSPHPKYVVASKPLGDGWYVNISGDTARRYEHMCQISDRLQLGLKVDLI